MNCQYYQILCFILITAATFINNGCNNQSATPPKLPPQNKNPTCVITTPGEGTSLALGDTIQVIVTAKDVDGQIIYVNFYIDEQLRHTDYQSPFCFNWNTSEDISGGHAIRVEAMDNDESFSSHAITVTSSWVYNQPEQIIDGWETATPESVGLDSTCLISLMNRIYSSRDHKIHGILIARYGQLVFEEYFDGFHRIDQNNLVHFTRTVSHCLASVTKSFTSALLGIAIDRGFIRGVDQPIYEFFPEFEWMADGTKADITIEHMINMCSGLQWDQSLYPTMDPRNDAYIFYASDDPWQTYLSRPMEAVPGTHMSYSEASLNVVGECIRRSTGLRLHQFANTYLFYPMEIYSGIWAVTRHGWYSASGDISMRPREMLKFGQLYLQNGVWLGEQLIPVEWIERASEPYHLFDSSSMVHEQHWMLNADMIGYSDAWWELSPSTYGQNAFAANGWGGQRIMVLKEHDMVVVFTGGSEFEEPLITPHEMMVHYILPSIQ